MTRILCVSNTAFYLHNFRLGLLRTLRDQGFDVSLAAPEDSYAERLRSEGFRLIPVKHLDRKGSNPLADLRFLLESYRLYKREKPDLVLHFTIKVNVFGAIAARLARTRALSTITGLGWLFINPGLKTRLGRAGYELLYRIALSFSSKVFFQNEDDRQFFVRKGIVNEQKSAWTPGAGIDTTHFCPGSLPPRDNGGTALVFLFIGRMLWDKGVREFADAARVVKQAYPAAAFHLLGPIDTENRSAISQSVIDGWVNADVVKYLGHTDDVRPFIRDSAVVVLPSYREGTPRSLLEAMAMERPVIATDVPGCREVVEDGRNGLLVPVRDAQALASAMKQMIEKGEGERSRMGAYGRRKVVNEYDERITVDQYIRAIREALASASQRQVTDTICAG
jgi:glycosyltransferase involved in cell wall biosynthesis